MNAGVPLALGIALILLVEGGSSDLVRFVFGALCFAAGFGVAWAVTRG